MPGTASRAQLDTLRLIPLLRELGDSDLALIAAKLGESSPAPGTELLVQGREADGVYFLKEGTVEILVNGEIIALKDTVECFGEMSCLTGEPNASATVRTAGRSRILKITRPDFLAAVNQIPMLWKSLFLQMNARFIAMGKRLGEVLSHTPQGLIKVDKAGRITNEYSVHCTSYFGTRELAGQPFAELAFPGGGEARKHWQDAYAALFEVPDTAFEVMSQLLAAETSVPREGGGTREFRLSYYPCIANRAIVAVDVGMEDVTEAREFARANSALETEKQILRKVYDNPDPFLNLLDLMDAALEKLARLGAGPGADAQASVLLKGEVFRLLHTVKGMAGQFTLEGSMRAAHDLEGCLEAIERPEGRPELYADGVQALRQQAAYARSLIENLSRNLKERLLGVVFSQDDFARLRETVQREGIASLRPLLERIERIDARRLVREWSEEAARLSARLGKETCFAIEGDAVPIPRGTFNRLEPVLGHLLRNGIDHGLESPEERQRLGKPAAGSLVAAFSRDGAELVIEITDDGRGLDYDRITAKARSSPRLDPARVGELLARGETWKILFLPGFSTAAEVSEISGRGVGLDAVLDAVNALGGGIAVRTERGRGTTFVLRVRAE